MNVIFFRSEFIEFFGITVTSSDTTPVEAVTVPPPMNGANNTAKANNDSEHPFTSVLE